MLYIDYGMTVLSADIFDSCLPDEAFNLAIFVPRAVYPGIVRRP